MKKFLGKKIAASIRLQYGFALSNLELYRFYEKLLNIFPAEHSWAKEDVPMKKLFSLIVVTASLCYFSLAFSASFEKTKRAAEWGDSTAQLKLGFAYATGQGVPQNYQKARQWWKRSAAQGSPNTQLNLGIMYVVGHGVRQDFSKARGYGKIVPQPKSGTARRVMVATKTAARTMHV